MTHAKILFVLAVGLAVAGCQTDATNSRVTVDTSDGQALPHASLTGGASQVNISRSMTVSAGQTTKLAFFAFVNPDCTNVGYAQIRETEPPANGSLEVKQTEDFAFWPEKNPRSACNKTRVKGVMVRYTPKAGFTGIDNLAYELFGPASGMRHVAVTMNVL